MSRIDVYDVTSVYQDLLHGTPLVVAEQYDQITFAISRRTVSDFFRLYSEGKVRPLFQISYTLEQPERRVVLAVLRSDDDPFEIEMATVIFFLFVRYNDRKVPMRLGFSVSYRPYEQSTKFLVDGFPVYSVSSSLLPVSRVREFIRRLRALMSL